MRKPPCLHPGPLVPVVWPSGMTLYRCAVCGKFVKKPEVKE